MHPREEILTLPLPALQDKFLQLLAYTEKLESIVDEQAKIIATHDQTTTDNNLKQQEYIASLEASLEQSATIIAEQEITIKNLQDRVFNLEKMIFGSKTESKSKLTTKKQNGNKGVGSEDKIKKKKRKCKKTANAPDRSNTRKPPASLPKNIINLELPEKDKICPCCNLPLTEIGAKKSPKVDIVPALLKIIEYHRKQYACSKCKCKQAMKTAPLPEDYVDKLMATPRLVAWVINQKYNYNMPLYRISKMFTQHGYKLSPNTIWGWMKKYVFYLQILYSRMLDLMLQEQHIFTDDTTAKLIVKGLLAAKTARLWVYITKGQNKIVIYDFTSTREGKHPQKILSGFKGYLQSDAYAGYHALYEDNEGNIVVIPVFCMAHCRRKFYAVAEKSEAYGLADQALEFIDKLYDIEHLIKNSNINARYEIRQEKSIPILKDFHDWLKVAKNQVMPKTELMSAIGYALNNWSPLTNYCLSGELEVDNNRSERKMKSLKIGEKNYLFFGSEQGGCAAAILYSFIETCKENKIDPVEWMTDIIPKLNYYKTSHLDELLPFNWGKNIEFETSAAQAA